MASSASTPTALASQVGGHAGVLATEDGSLVIKPALPLEVQFYQALHQHADLEPLRPFIPNFIGTLRLEGELDEKKSAEEGNISVTPVDDVPEKDECVLSILGCNKFTFLLPSWQNVSYPFLKPNILDVKLGTVLYDETASPEKVERMINTAKNTTSLETGIRLTGFQVYDNSTSLPVLTPKSYGKSIKPADLLDGISRFFPVGSQIAQEGEQASASVSTSGLPSNTLLAILYGIRDDVADIREIYSEIEMRMVAASLLIVYEADWTRAEESLKRLEEGDEEEEDEEDEDEDEEEESAKRRGPPYAVKLIDFAHTRLTPGKGPDEGVLLGMDTLLKLIDQRIDQLEKAT
ncbi:hypothetical protein H0H92_008063 [Tricholoma furcatifolium]|nr:hypothetical protein H0H92_008063 [Tricholoma furcatifolium]